ncbi:unnamed protein product, partial [marine sediment metagenome]
MVQVNEKIHVSKDGKRDSYLGIDVGSVTLKFVLMDNDQRVLSNVFLRNQGSPIDSVKFGMAEMR